MSHLVELLGRDERWPDRMFRGRCEGRSTMCQCDGEGKGCRTQRLFAVALMKLKKMQEDQALLKERFEIRYEYFQCSILFVLRWHTKREKFCM